MGMFPLQNSVYIQFALDVQVCVCVFSEFVCAEFLDVVLLFDVAGDAPPSLTDADSYFNFVFDLLTHFDTASFNTTRLAALTAAQGSVSFAFQLGDTSLSNAARVEAINATATGGLLDLAFAISTLRTTAFQSANGHRTGATKVAIYITDQLSTMNSAEVEAEAFLAHSAGIRIYSVGVGSDVFSPGTDALLELQTVAADPRIADQDFFVINDFASLDGSRVSIAQEVCTATPPSVPRMTSACLSLAFAFSLYFSFCVYI